MGTVRVPLSQGKFAFIDEADVPLVEGYLWAAAERPDGGWYAMAYDSYNGGKQRQLLLHRQIIQPADGVLVDHRTGDGLDCRRCNLRETDHTGNMRNRRKQTAPTSSRFKGVSFKQNAWEVTIRAGGRPLYLGRYTTEEAAARAYDDAARKHHGEFARLNFPDEVTVPLPDPNAPIITLKPRIAQVNNTSGFRGVFLHKNLNRKKWHATIHHESRVISCGYYLTAEEAARAYDAKARELLGDKARLNFPD